VYGKQGNTGREVRSPRWEQGKIWRNYTTKRAKRREPTNMGPEPGLEGMEEGSLDPHPLPTNTPQPHPGPGCSKVG